jgi:DNA-binding transcriptional regulator GbsR (MarR family)
MSNKIVEIHESVIETMGRISSFWGFSKIMGQLYGLLYLSSKPLTLQEMAESLSISKGNVSINIRNLLRWNMVKRVWVKGDRKDYYEAETDFWKIIRGVLREREKKEFSQALSSIGKLRQQTKELKRISKTADIAFTEERLKNLEEFIANMDKMVSVFITLEDLKKNFWDLTKKA